MNGFFKIHRSKSDGFIKLTQNKKSNARNIYTLDGIDDYISLPNYDFNDGESVSFKFIASNIAIHACFIGRDSNGRTVWNESGVIVLSSVVKSALLDGELIINRVTPTPSDNIEHKIEVVFNVGGSINSCGASGGGIGYNLGAAIYDIEFGGRFYPVDDGWHSNPTIKDMLSGQDGAAINFQESGWSK